MCFYVSDSMRLQTVEHFTKKSERSIKNCTLMILFIICSISELFPHGIYHKYIFLLSHFIVNRLKIISKLKIISHFIVNKLKIILKKLKRKINSR